MTTNQPATLRRIKTVDEIRAMDADHSLRFAVWRSNISVLVDHIDVQAAELATLRQALAAAEEDKNYLLRLVNSAYSHGVDGVWKSDAQAAMRMRWGDDWKDENRNG